MEALSMALSPANIWIRSLPSTSILGCVVKLSTGLTNERIRCSLEEHEASHSVRVGGFAHVLGGQEAV